MTRDALRQGLISIGTISEALMLGRGDLFISASHLGVTARELDSYIRSSDELQGFVAAIGTLKKNSDYDKLSADQFAEQLEQLTRAYRVEAVDIIHDLATMGFDSAAMAEVKLKAAIQLRGSHHESPQDAGQVAVLHELNQIYRETAPKIKTIRAVQIEME